MGTEPQATEAVVPARAVVARDGASPARDRVALQFARFATVGLANSAISFAAYAATLALVTPVTFVANRAWSFRGAADRRNL